MRILVYCIILNLLQYINYEACAQVFPVNTIPSSLKTDADAVVRFSEMNVIIKSAGNLKVQMRKVVTVLNQKGEGSGEFFLGYDKFIKPSALQIRIYDAAGNVIKKVKNDEINDYSAYDGFSLFTDNRIKHYRPLIRSYPYTVEYSYELSYDGYVTLPRWVPVTDYKMAVQFASFSVSFDTLLLIRHKQLNIEQQADLQIVKNIKTLQWKLNDLLALTYEPYSPGLFSRVPSVLLACNAFEYDGSTGNFSDWNSYGRWINSLSTGRQELPDATKQKVHLLIDGVIDDRQKAAILYEYMQDRMRYVSISLGIGGFQPFTAAEVDKWSYGDCKALSNYYISLLKEAGIRGLYAVTVSGNELPMFYEDFPANLYFNHAVACIPFENDTVWVECTNNYYPFGFMSRSVAGHPALLATEAGGTLVRVPALPAHQNNEFRKLELELAANGSARLTLVDTYTGLQLTSGISKYILSSEDQKKNLYEELELNDFEIENHNYIYKKGRNPFVKLTASVYCNKIASVSGDRMFVPVKILDSQWAVPETIENRHAPVYIPVAYADCDSVIIRIPDGYVTESLPKELNLDTEFGRYRFQVVESDKQLLIIRSILLDKKKYIPEKYNAFRDFIGSMNKAEKQKLILKKAG
jgi:hypothetical protein